MFQLIDISRDVVIAPRVTKADTFVSRAVGLLGRAALPEEEGLWIEPCNSIHMFFMRFPIDVAFFDRNGVVIRRIDAIRPWRATKIHSNARGCVELAAGVLAKAGVVEGSILQLVPVEKS